MKTPRAVSTEFLFTTRGVKGIGAKIDIDMGRMRPEDFTPLYGSFIHAAGCRKSPELVTMFTLYPDQCDSGIYWHEALCPDGMRLTLVVPPEADAVTLKSVQTRLRARFDVISMKTLRVHEWVELPKNYPHSNMPTIKQNEMDESVLMTRALSLLGYIDSLFQDHGRKPLSERALALREYIRKELKNNPYNTNDPEKGYYHQFFLTEVLGEEVLHITNLSDLHESVTGGHFSGETGQSPITWTNKALTEELLMAQASDPTFLNKNNEDHNQ